MPAEILLSPFGGHIPLCPRLPSPTASPCAVSTVPITRSLNRPPVTRSLTRTTVKIGLFCSLNITLRSVNGAEKTEIRRIGGTVGIFYLTAPEAVVDGFTIVNALDAAVYLYYGGVVSNCVIRDNNIPGSGGYGGGVLMTGGWLKHCQIINNTRTSTGGGGTRGCGISMSGAAVVESCIIANNNTSTGYGSAGASSTNWSTSVPTKADCPAARC